jgi:hypothetical protein
LIHVNTDIRPDPPAVGGPHDIDNPHATLMLEVARAVAASIVPDPAARVESSVEAAAANIHHL